MLLSGYDLHKTEANAEDQRRVHYMFQLSKHGGTLCYMAHFFKVNDQRLEQSYKPPWM